MCGAGIEEEEERLARNISEKPFERLVLAARHQTASPHLGELSDALAALGPDALLLARIADTLVDEWKKEVKKLEEEY